MSVRDDMLCRVGITCVDYDGGCLNGELWAEEFELKH
jgi:hypothetical protein